MDSVVPRPAPSQTRAHSAAAAALVCAGVVVSGALGLVHAPAGSHVTLLWAPAGVAIAAVARWGPAVLPGVLVGTVAAHLLVGGHAATASGIALTDTAAAALAGALLRRARFDPRLRTRRDLACWLIVAAGVAPTAAAIGGLAAQGLTGALASGAARTFQTAWVGHATGGLVVGPLVLAWADPEDRPRTPRALGEVALLCLVAGSAAAAGCALPVLPGHGSALTLLLPLPIVVWGALRFGLRGALAASAAFGGAELVLVALGEGPLGAGGATTSVALWVLVTLHALTALLLGFLVQSWRDALAHAAAAEERLALAAEGALAGTWDWDLKTGQIIRNEQWMRMLGREAAPVPETAAAWEALIHPLDRRRAEAAWHAHVGGDTPRYSVEIRMQHADGRWRWILDQGVIVGRDARGRPTRAAGTQTDITTRKRAELQEFGMRRLARALSDATSTVDVRAALLAQVHGLVEARHVSLLAASGRPGMLEVVGVDGPTHVPVAATLAGLDDPRRPTVRRGDADGAAVDSPVVLDGELVGLIALRGVDAAAVDADVLDRLATIADHCAGTLRRLQSDARREAVEASMLHAQKLESLGVLAGGIAHDFNNLLATISGNTGLALLDLDPSHPAHEPLQDVELAASRAAELCRQLLAYAGRGRFVTEVVDMGTLAREMAKLLDLGRREKARLVFDLDPNVPPVSVDAAQIRQVLLNLITNASDALPGAGGTVTVRTRSRRLDRAALSRMWVDDDLPEGNYVELQVEDDGCGMPPDVLSRVFDPFFTTRFSGRGLGLAAVLGILRGHRGAVRIETEEGAGTTFFVYLPAVEARVTVGPVEDVAEPTTGPGTALVVDDEPELRRLVARALAQAGWETHTAANGADGVARFEKAPDRYDVVVLDMTMPVMGGAEALARMRAVRSTVRVVLTSGFAEHEDAVRLENAPTVTFLPKPWTPDQLLGAIARLWSAGAPPSPPARTGGGSAGSEAAPTPPIG